MQGAPACFFEHEAMFGNVCGLCRQGGNIEAAGPGSQPGRELTDAHRTTAQFALFGLGDIVAGIGADELMDVGVHRAELLRQASHVLEDAFHRRGGNDLGMVVLGDLRLIEVAECGIDGGVECRAGVVEGGVGERGKWGIGTPLR